MAPGLAWTLTLLLAYLLGSVPFGLVIGRAWKGVDIRQHGSGNLGATNALRVLGKRVGALVLALDAAKGALPVLAGPALAELLGAPAPAWLPVALAGAAIVGHVFPIALRFKGGKGVATSAGALVALHPAAVGLALVAFVLTVALTRWVSLGSVAAALALPALALLLDGPEAALGPHFPRSALFLLVAALVVVRHRGNLRRVLRGEEPRLGATSPPDHGEEEAP